MPILRRPVSLLVLTLASPALALAQPCTPAWDGTLGRPGIVGGYCGAFGSYDPGTGEIFYAGGSFSQIAGIPGSGFAAGYNPITQKWSKLGTGISQGNTNAFVTSLVPFSHGSLPGLFVGGFFDKCGGVANTRSFAVWNGTQWKALPNNPVNVSPASIWSIAAWEHDPSGTPRIYVGGSGLADVAGTPSNGIQSWDGAQFHAVATVNGVFSPTVFKLYVYNDGSGEKLYAGGRLNNLQGITTPLILRYDGTNWSKVGNGLVATDANFAQISAMTAHNDGTANALYVAGGSFRVNASGQTITSVAKWDGTTWSRVGQNIGGVVYGLASWDDGTGPALYLGGTAVPGVNYVAKLINNIWTPLDGGVSGTLSGNFPSVFSLTTWNYQGHNNLIVGGDFTTAGSSEPANGIVTRAGCFNPCPADFNNDGFLNGNDFDTYSDAFIAGDITADFNHDTFVTADDYDAYVLAFEAGC